VGLAAIKALAEVLQKPIAAVSLLEVVVRASGTPGDVVVALDASRGEVYTADFQVSRQQTTAQSQQLLTLADFASANTGRQIITPDAKIADFIREKGLRVTQIDRPRADTIARLGFEKIQVGDVVSPESLDANYFRRSDAEVKRSGDVRK
jgi:tRNA A37 threonylcarbamoyladenosine modification protein TsaB